jgi:hypothetical protein
MARVLRILVALGALSVLVVGFQWLATPPNADSGARVAPEPPPTDRAPRVEAPDPEPAIEEPVAWPADAPRQLHGVVTNELGDPVARATVRVVPRGRNREILVTKTGADGQYVLDRVPGKPDRLEVTARGYEPRTFRSPSFPAAPRVSWDVELQQADGVFGVVLVDGRPASGALVRIWKPEDLPKRNRRPIARAFADGDGRFAADPDYDGAMVVDATHGSHGRKSVEVDGPGEVTVELPGGGFVEGRVVDTHGNPVGSFTLTATPMLFGTGAPAAQSFDDGNGGFRLGPLAQGNHTLWAASEGYQPSRVRKIPIRPGQTHTGVVLKLVPSGFVVGRVTDERTGRPIAGATVTPAEWSSSALAESVGAWTDDDGNYKLTAVPGRRSSVRVSAPGYNSILAGGVDAPPGKQVRRDYSLTRAADPDRPRGELTGIGAMLSRTRDGVRVARIFEGGPAAEVLDTGDVIVMVGDLDARKGVAPVAQAIRGEIGTDVALWVKRGGKGEPERVVLTRDRVSVPQRHHRN